MLDETKINTKPYIIGAIGNLFGFLIGSMYLIRFITPMFSPLSEYRGTLLWAFSGLVLAAIGNIVCVIISAPRNVFSTIIGASIGLTIGLIVSLFPNAFFVGIVTIFLGALSGHYKKWFITKR